METLVLGSPKFGGGLLEFHCTWHKSEAEQQAHLTWAIPSCGHNQEQRGAAPQHGGMPGAWILCRWHGPHCQAAGRRRFHLNPQLISNKHLPCNFSTILNMFPNQLTVGIKKSRHSSYITVSAFQSFKIFSHQEVPSFKAGLLWILVSCRAIFLCYMLTANFLQPWHGWGQMCFKGIYLRDASEKDVEHVPIRGGWIHAHGKLFLSCCHFL